MLDAIELRQGKLVLPDYHKDTDTFSVEAELCVPTTTRVQPS